MKHGRIGFLGAADIEDIELGRRDSDEFCPVHGLLVWNHVAVELADVPEAAEGKIEAPSALVPQEDYVVAGDEEGDIILDTIHEDGVQGVDPDILLCDCRIL